MKINKLIGKMFHRLSHLLFALALVCGYSHQDMYNDYYKRKLKNKR